MQPWEICSQPWNSRSRRARQVAGEVLELEVALGAQRVGVEELGQLVDLARAEGDVDEGEALEDLVLDRLRPAAADADHPVRVFGLQPLRLAEVGDEAAVGRLADRAGVEEDQVGLLAARRLLVAERGQHPPHPLGVVHVHLAPERGDVEALHPRQRTHGAGAKQIGGRRERGVLRTRATEDAEMRRLAHRESPFHAGFGMPRDGAEEGVGAGGEFGADRGRCLRRSVPEAAISLPSFSIATLCSIADGFSKSIVTLPGLLLRFGRVEGEVGRARPPASRSRRGPWRPLRASLRLRRLLLRLRPPPPPAAASS